jgi:hypothetical protein
MSAGHRVLLVTDDKPKTVEQRARAVWKPGMTGYALAKSAGISRGAASKWANILATEHRGHTVAGTRRTTTA